MRIWIFFLLFFLLKVKLTKMIRIPLLFVKIIIQNIFGSD